MAALRAVDRKHFCVVAGASQDGDALDRWTPNSISEECMLVSKALILPAVFACCKAVCPQDPLSPVLSTLRASCRSPAGHTGRNDPYDDAPQPIHSSGATISAPHMHAACLHILASSLQPGAQVAILKLQSVCSFTASSQHASVVPAALRLLPWRV